MATTRAPRRLPAILATLALALTGAVTALTPEPAFAANDRQVVLVGSLQSELGCAEDWQTNCAATTLIGTDVDGVYAAEFSLPAGTWEYKVALDGTWDEAYGLDGGDANIPLVLPGEATLRFSYDDGTHRVGLQVLDLRGDYSEADAELVADPVRSEGAGEQFYFVLTDRFANGDPANDTAGLGDDPLVSGHDPTNQGFYHGGDIAGLTNRLDYIEGLGTTAIWLTPSFTNQAVQGTGADASAGYHGYWITDFTQIDPHLGTNAELEAFIEDAHARGIDVYFDIITNHTADLIDYAEGEYGYIDQATSPYLTADGVPFDPSDVAGSPDFPALDAATSFPYTPVRAEARPAMVPDWLNDVTLYHNRGNSTWSGESVTYGDFDGLDDLMTEDPEVVEGMIDIYTTWMDLGIDGFRIDTVKHVNPEFWETFTAAITEHAGAIGNDDFFSFGEVYDADARLISPYVRDTDMDAVLDFAYQAAAANYARGAGANALAGLFASDDHYTTPTSSADALPTFLGNHDMGRLGYLLGDVSDPLQRSELAHSLMYLTRGQPVVYYGDEQGFIGTGNDKGARQSLFASQTPLYIDQPLLTGEQAGSVDRYDTDAPLYTHIAELAALRSANPALSGGAQIELAADGGVYAFARVDRTERVEHLVALNNETAARTITLTTLTPGATYATLYGTPQTVTADAAGEVSLTVDPLSAVVLRADAQVAVPSEILAPVLTPLPGSAVEGLAPIGADASDHTWSETTFSVRVVGTQDWQLLGTAEDTTPRVFHDTGDLAAGTLLEYRAVTVDAAGNRTAASTYANVGFAVNGVVETDPGAATVTIPGTHNTAMGCASDWSPDCEAAALTLGEHGLYTGTFDLPAGAYEYKVAIGGSWAENYGVGGVRDGANSSYTHAGGPVTFYYDPVTHYFSNTAQTPVVTLPGSLNSEVGCAGDWDPGCLRTWMQDPDGDGVFTWSTNALPAGGYEVKVAHGLSWDENYGAGGAAGGANIAFTVGAGQFVQFAYDLATHQLTIAVTDYPTAGVGQWRVHWLDQTTIAVPRDLLPAGAAPTDLAWALVTAPDGGLTLAGNDVTGGTATGLEVIDTGLDPQLRERYPHLADSVALAVTDLDRAAVEAALTGQLALTAHNAGGALTVFTGVQLPGVLDDLYAQDAAQAPLGATWHADGAVSVAVWAPTARDVDLLLFDDGTGTGEPERLAATRQADGTWTVAGAADWRDRAYLWDIEVYVPGTDAVEHNVVTDPYSVALTVDSTHSVLVDLDDPSYQPALWADTPNPDAIRGVDQTIYELHVRDFSIADESVPEPLRGSYAAFTQTDSAGMTHLRDLADAGLTTVHLLPTFDIATIPEARAEQSVPVVPDAAPDSPGQQAAVMAAADTDGFNWGYDPLHFTTPEGSYASPGHQDGGARVAEFRSMVGALHDADLRVVLDQVFNHTAASGQDALSVLDRVVPGYYQRLDAAGQVETSTCCQNVATEHAMAQDLMVDSVLTWAREYRVDGFRFDLMGHHSRANLEAVRAALDTLTIAEDGVDGASIYLYGEGWNFGEVANNRLFEQATQGQLDGTGIGTFSDRLRDAVQGGHGTLQQQGFGTGLYTDNNAVTGAQTPGQLADLQHRADLVRLGLAGNLASYEFLTSSGAWLRGDQLDYNGQPAGYATSPEEVVTYVDAHDNETLYDLLALRLPADSTVDERVRMNTLALATTALSQTPSFWHAGTDLLRSKSLDRNSYNSGDHFNEIDWTMQDSVFGTGLPPQRDNGANWAVQGPLLADPALVPAPDQIAQSAAMAQDLLRLRFSTPLFRLGETDLITERVTFPGSGPDATAGLVVMSIDDAAGAYAEDVDAGLDGVLVVLNTTPDPITETVDGFAGRDLELSDVQAEGADEVVRGTVWDATSGTVTIPARTVAVLVDPAEPVVPLDPALTLSPASAGPGEQVEVAVTGFAPDEDVELTLGEGSLTVLNVDSAGAAVGAVTIPAQTAAGTYTVTATGLSSGVSAEAGLVVEVTEPPQCVDLPPGLAGWILRILIALLRALFPGLPEVCWT
ncbi:pullulanase-type alpha-1,6-glucosidase [Occultella glacieicola]|uniref:Pullulanase-type alpha-1,6-glucosidase n=1 Tax=Occultella glacieicola TaxID=2518684 RepID=A0ABY2EBG7_9MICO|nr:pullulanase-type alpha-1,6-glucosidase [Occultella glacieicola]TDE97574.1 pullulanase-type alpha-1,6-glucosidase [Occultella glacieicola]